MNTLPDELLLGVINFLSVYDLTQVSLACERLNRVATSLLWASIELHNGRYHERGSKYVGLLPAICPSKRFFMIRKEEENASRKAQGLFTILQQYREQGDNRVVNLCAQVVSICTTVIPGWRAGRLLGPGSTPQGVQVWELFPLFINLEILELHAEHSPSHEHEVLLSEITAPPLPKLRCVKLFGDIPWTFATWILQSAATLQRLELGMVDRTISGSDYACCDKPRSRPEEKVLLNQSLDGDDPNQGSDYGSLDGEFIIPRPLGRFLSANTSRSDETQTECSLPQLEHLYLCQLSKGQYDESSAEYSWSTRADKACLADWRQLLLACNQTLKVLVLEQRPSVEFIETDSMSFFMTYNEEEIGSETLVSMMEEILSIKGSFPMLKDVYLYGMPVGLDRDGNELKDGLEELPVRKLMQSLRKLGIACEARLGMWYIFNDSHRRWNTTLARVRGCAATRRARHRPSCPPHDPR